MGSTSGFGFTGTFVQVKPGSIVHVAEQPSPPTVLPSSHSFLSPGNSRPLPHTVLHGPPPGGHTGSRRQSGEHPSPVTVLPSSHCSEPSCLPLPQVVAAHTVGPVQPPAPLALVHDQPSAFVAARLSRVQSGLQPSTAPAV